METPLHGRDIAAATVVELTVDQHSYRIVLPDSETDYIQKKILTERQPYEHEMLNDMRSRLKPGELVFDVGANVGNHTLYLAAVAGCRVEAFEPNESLCAAIRRSVELNPSVPAVHVHACGLGRSVSEARFDAVRTGNLGAQRLKVGSGAIRVEPLDGFAALSPVRAIKIDVEGMELDVLAGAAQTIARDRPLLYIECITEHDFRAVMHFLEPLAYCYWATFNATPTHLLMPAEQASLDQRISRLQYKSAQDEYRNAQMLREIRVRLAQAQTREKEVQHTLQQVEAELKAKELGLATAIATVERLGREVQAVQSQRDGGLAELDRVGQQLAMGELERDRQMTEIEALRHLIAASEQALVLEQSERATLLQRLDDAESRGQALALSLESSKTSALKLQEKLARSERGLRDSASKLSTLEEDRQRLKRQIELRAARLDALQQRATALSRRNERIVASASNRIGEAFVAVARSPGKALRLPLELWGIYRDALRRRGERGGIAHAPTAQDAQPYVTLPKVPPTRDSSPPQQHGEQRTAKDVTKDLTPAPQPAALKPPEDLRKLKVASVMDEFTFHSFAPECQLLPLRLATWESQVSEFAPDLVFIESAWRGANDEWTQKVSNPSAEIMGLIAWCRLHGVPSIFWNKEDPVHFGGFQHIARAVDHVFTTDIDCIARYRRELGHDRVYLLPFAAQPAVHNPIERFDRQDAFCFAGSYYLKYPERQRDFRNLIDMVSTLRPVEIYDRNFHKPHPHYEFPAEYERYIVGSLPFDQIDKAYKGYRFGINMNTIKQSQTMFARRVFELLASNTIVVSNFSRGVRLMFGDLVICSDAPNELQRRLSAVCADETHQRKYRLAGVRKTLSEHTYAQRLAYIASKVSGELCKVGLPKVTVLAWARDAQEAERVLRMFGGQTHEARELLLVCDETGSAAVPHVRVLRPTDAEGIANAFADAAWFAPWSSADYYGPNYLTDLALATSYSSASVIGKACFYEANGETVTLRNDGSQYRSARTLDARASLVRGGVLAARPLFDGNDIDRRVLDADEMLAIDEFNYCRNAKAAPEDAVVAAVGDLGGLRTGLSMADQLFPLAEAIQGAGKGSDATDAIDLPGLSGADIAAMLPARLPSALKLEVSSQSLLLRSKLVEGKHAYLYLDRIFTRAELNLELNSRFQLVLDRPSKGLDLRTVFEFLDQDQRKISHAMAKAGAAHSMAIPARCQFVRFGLRVESGGSATVQRLLLADPRERPSALVNASAHLLVAKQYPSYDDLYRYGFVHSRVRGYRRHGLNVDVFRLNDEEPCAFREFEGVDVVQGDRDLLDLALRGGRYEHVMVHLLDPKMWETIERHLDRVKVTVWVHGAEIQTWQRRAFEFERFDADEVERRKALAEQRKSFWQRILTKPHPNLSLVFVSRYLADEVRDDIGIDLGAVRHEVIHNPIDGDLFPYVPKDAEQRKQVLSIRPFASRVYANDLTVRAIELLSSRPSFADMSFRIIGDGDLFDSTTKPIVGLANVTLERRFLTQPEIAALHRTHGVFLCPTRMDTQGVSRDEAMASGLVPVTTRVAAVPEFTDADCAMLVEPEDAQQLADAVEALYADPARFQRLSAAAAARVRLDSGESATVMRELELLGWRDAT